MRNVIIFSLFLFNTLAGYSQSSDKIEGVVRVAGGGLNQEIQLILDGEEKPAVLCENDISGRIKKLAAMTVEVGGSWRSGKHTGKRCFTGSEFKILKHISGREPLVGVLSKNENSFSVKAEDGKDTLIKEVPAGLAKLEGKKVVLDVKSISTSKQKTFKVVSYGEYP